MHVFGEVANKLDMKQRTPNQKEEDAHRLVTG